MNTASKPVNWAGIRFSIQAIPLAMVTPLGAGIGFAILYLATPTADYFWDGITFALQIEKVANGERGVALLFHQSHLLYNVFGYLLYKAAHLAGWQIRALDLLQIINSIIGGIGIGALMKISLRLTRNRYASLIAALFLAVSVTWWKLSTDCDTYILATTLLLLCLANLTSRKPRWQIAGFWFALAMLTHELASLFTLAAIVIVWTSDQIREKRRFALLMTGLAWSIAVGIYYLSAAALLGMTNPLRVVGWATTNPSLITPEINPLPGIFKTPRTNFDMLFGHSVTLFRLQHNWLAQAFAIVALLFALLFLFTAWQNRRLFRFLECLLSSLKRSDKFYRQIFLFLAAWIVPFNIFLCFFEPGDPYLRVFYAPAIALGISWAISLFHADRTSDKQGEAIQPHREPGLTPLSSSYGTAAFAIGAIAYCNLAFAILLFMRADANPLITEANRANLLWDQQTVILFARHNEADTTFEYFNEKSRWRKIQPDRTSMLADEIDTIRAQGGNVWLNRGALQAVGDAVFERYEKGEEIVVERDFSPAHYVELIPR